MKAIRIFSLILITALFPLSAQDFDEGSYGTGYYDTAGPFSVPDLNAPLLGDINGDEIVNVQDIIIVVGAIIGTTELTPEEFAEADQNFDQQLDVLDVVFLVSQILDPQEVGWDFQSNWNGEDCYIFIQYDASVTNSSALWSSDTKEALLENSPDNVHYFFISNRLQSSSDISAMQSNFDEILADADPDFQIHWNSHLHFVSERTSQLDNWLPEALSGKYALGIDRFQRIRQIGYLGNPNGFTGTHMSYLAHEAIYYNYEWNTFSDLNSDMLEITVFDSVPYGGGWSPTLVDTVVFPDSEVLETIGRMEIEAFLPCPDYDDGNCDDWDRIARLRVCELDGTDCVEIARWITPFDRQPHWLTDITPFVSALHPGGPRQVRFTISGWPNNMVTVKLRLYSEIQTYGTPREVIPLWTGAQFNEDYNENFDPQIFAVPENAARVELVAFITGHGMGCDTGNCAEFCNSGHFYEVNGGNNDGYFEQTHPTAGDTDYCMEPERIAQGTIPNQWGTWGYGRAGWCPGLDVPPFIHDITPYIFTGDENVITYEGCYIQYESQGCTDWPAPVDCGGGYQAEIIYSSYIVIWY